MNLERLRREMANESTATTSPNDTVTSCIFTLNHLLNESVSHSVVSDSMRPYGVWPARFLCPWNSPGKNTGVGCHVLLQGIFQTQGLNPNLLWFLHWRQNLCCWDTREACNDAYFASTLISCCKQRWEGTSKCFMRMRANTDGKPLRECLVFNKCSINALLMW